MHLHIAYVSAESRHGLSLRCSAVKFVVSRNNKGESVKIVGLGHSLSDPLQLWKLKTNYIRCLAVELTDGPPKCKRLRHYDVHDWDLPPHAHCQVGA